MTHKNYDDALHELYKTALEVAAFLDHTAETIDALPLEDIAGNMRGCSARLRWSYEKAHDLHIDAKLEQPPATQHRPERAVQEKDDD